MQSPMLNVPNAISLLPFEEVVWLSPERLSGAPCFAHTRVPVKALFDYLEGGETIDAFLDDFEGVTRVQILSALFYGKERLMPSGLPQPTGRNPSLSVVSL